MAVKLFAAGSMASESVKSFVRSVKFQAAGAYAEVNDGAMVVVGDLAANDTYGGGGVDANVHYATAPAVVTDKVAVVDIAGVTEGAISGNVYRESIKQYDLKGVPGVPVRIRTLFVTDKCYFGEGNFAVAPVKGQYAILTANSTELSVAAAKPAAGFAAKILDIVDLTTGQLANGKRVLVEVVQL